MAIIENKLIGNTLLVTINNPSKRNSMIIGFHDELQSTIKMGEENNDVLSELGFSEKELNDFKNQEII